MKMLKVFFAAVFLFAAALPALADEETIVLAVFIAPEGMTMTAESIRNGEIRRYIDEVAASADARVVSVFEYLSLAGKDRKIFVSVASDTKTSEQLIADLKANPAVLSASPNRTQKIH